MPGAGELREEVRNAAHGRPFERLEHSPTLNRLPGDAHGRVLEQENPVLAVDRFVRGERGEHGRHEPGQTLEFHGRRVGEPLVL